MESWIKVWSGLSKSTKKRVITMTTLSSIVITASSLLWALSIAVGKTITKVLGSIQLACIILGMALAIKYTFTYYNKEVKND